MIRGSVNRDEWLCILHWNTRVVMMPTLSSQPPVPLVKQSQCLNLEHFLLYLISYDITWPGANFTVPAQSLVGRGDRANMSFKHYKVGILTLHSQCTFATGLNNSIGPTARYCPKWTSGNHICGPKMPAKLVFWKFGQQTFFVRQPAAHCTPYAISILRDVLSLSVESTFVYGHNDLISIVFWLCDQLIIEPWYESSMA